MAVAADANLVLIGMPGVGKSTVGVLLAKATSRAFVDTDLLIQAAERRPLQAILDAEGVSGFCAVEARTLAGLALERHVIATGGSAVYSDAAMEHLRKGGVTIHLRLPLPQLERRLTDLRVRGVAMEAGRSLRDLLREREPLYRRHADVEVDTTGLDQDGVVARIIAAL